MSKLYKRILLPLLLMILSGQLFASHIVGGTLTYTYSGVGNTYSVTLILYRDCSGAAFPGSAAVVVLQADGTLFSPSLNFTLPGGTISNVPPVLPPCATSPSVVPCVQQRVFTATVSIPPVPGGVHMYFSTNARNAAAVNILNPTAMGETFYAFIPCYRSKWVEDFTLLNGTTSDAGSTAWTRTLGLTPPTSAQVNAGQFEVVGSNNGMMVWASQTISISSYTNGVNLSINLNKAGTNFVTNDTLKAFYSINGGAKVLFPVNGNLVGNWTGPLFAKATGIVGTTIEIFVRAKFNNNNNSTGKTFFVDMVSLYDNTFLVNSNPTFVNLPPLLFCSTNSFSFSQAAADLDGDSLAYSMYTPFTHLPAPTFPNNLPSIPTVTWAAGYSANSPFNSGGPSVTLNPTTGVMTGVQNANGGRVFGVKCSEYRNGILLSESMRDYEVTAVTCPPFIPSAPGTGANTPLCAGQSLNLTATFSAGATYSWTGPNAFTSTSQNPSIAGTSTAASGTYSVFVTVAGCTGPPGTVAVTVNPNPLSPVIAGNTPVCTGQTLSLTAAFTAGASYNWSGPNSFTASVQNPSISGITSAAAGTYSLVQTVVGCNSPVSTVAIVVNNTPVAPTAGANTPLCQGQNLNLTSTFSAGATYTWAGPNSFTASTQNPSIGSVPLVATGMYSVNATIAGCSGPAGTVSVTVLPSPVAPTAGANSPLCVGQTLSLTASFTSGATYNWAGPNSFSSVSQNPTLSSITLAGIGTYSVNATIAGCTGPNGTVAVLVNPVPVAPTAGANTPLCAGLTLSLTSTFSAGASYNWSGPNSFVAAVQNPSISAATPAATGVYSVAASIAGCTGPTGTVSVNVSIPPSAPSPTANTPLCVGQTLSLSTSFTPGLTYNWTGPNSFSSVLQNPNISAITLAANGTYSVRATTAGGCSGPTNTIAVTVNPTPGTPTAGVNTPICAGQNLNFTANPGGGTFNWVGPNSFTASVQNPTISSASTLASGVYSVSTTIAGCTSTSGTISAIVNAIPVTPTAGSTPTLCAGLNISFTASSGGSTYNWTGPNSFVSTVQNPVITAASILASGTYSVTQTILGCTSLPGTTTSTVNPIPGIPSAGSNGPICALQTLSLTALPNGLLYSWTGPNSFTSNLQNPTIVGTPTLGAGNYSLVVNSLGCNSAAGTVAVVVNPTPPAPTTGGTPTLCAGGTINLTASPGGTGFNWTGPNSFTSTLQNPSIPGAGTVATGLYSVTASLAGCIGPAGTFSVNVFGNPSSPTLTANSPVCTGLTLSLTANAIPGASYAWTGPNGFSSSAQNPTLASITSAAAGSYSVAVNVSGCGSAINVIAVIVNTTPATPLALANAPICEGQNLILSTGAAGPVFLWTGPNSFTSALQNFTLVGASTLAAGVYSVVQIVNGCSSLPGTVSVAVNPIPTPPIAGSQGNLCVGQNLNLTATGPGTSFNWTGPNGFSSSLQNPTILGVTLLASGTYSVTQTNLGCTSTLAFTGVTVNPIPSSPTLSTNAPICALQTLSLSATGTGTIFNWAGPNSFTSSTQNPNISGTSVLASGNYSATQTVLGCTSPASTINVIINPAAPSPTAISNSPICLSQNINFLQTSISGASYSWFGPNSFTSANQSPTITGASLAASGTYSVFATVAGCPGPTLGISVLVSAPATITTGSSQTLCANNSTVALNASSSTGGGVWLSSGSGTFAPNTANGNYLPSAADLTAGFITLTITSTNNGGCTSVTNTLAVLFTPAPTVSAVATQTVCANNAQVTINGSVTIASGGIWSSSGTGAFTPTNTSLSASYTPSSADISAGSFTLSLTSTGNGNCFPVSNSKVVTISPAPVVVPGPNPQVVCKSNPNFQLNGSSTTGSGIWASSGTGTFSSIGVLNPVYFPSVADTTNGTVTLTLTSTNNGGCNSVSQTMTLVYVSTLAVNAGSDQVICSNVNVSLNGVSTTSAGIWSSSGTGSFSPTAASLITSYIPSASDVTLGLVTLTLTTANNGGCLPLTDVVSITITPGPTANAGSNQTVCANNAIAALSGSFTGAGGALWLTAGTGSFSPATNSLIVNYQASAADTTSGSVVITLSTTSNGSCSATTNTLLISFSPAPLVNAGPNINACKSNPIAVLNGSSSTGSASWTPLGTGTLLPGNTVLNPSYTPSAADTTAGSVTLILTSSNNGGCNPVQDTVIIFYSPLPTVSAGPSKTVCANNSSVALSGTCSTGSGTWSSSGTGTFSPNSLSGVYFPSASDITAGSMSLTLNSTNNAGCAPVADQLVVYVTPAPVVNAGSGQTICSNTPSVNLNGSFSISAGAIWSSTGSGTFVPGNTNMNASYLLSPGDTLSAGFSIFLNSTGNGNCLQVNDSIHFSIIKAPFADAGSDQFLCPGISASLSGTSSVGTYTWSSGGNGVFSNASTINPVYTPGSGDIAAGNVKLFFITGLTTCGAAADSLLLTFKPKPTAAFNYQNPCLGNVSTFSDQSVSQATLPVISWLWHFNNDTSSVPNPSYSFTSLGQQTVSLLVSNGICLDSVVSIVVVHPLPTSSFLFNKIDEETIQFIQTASVSTGAVNGWQWNFGDNNNSVLKNPIHVYQDTGFFLVTLTVLTDSNCTADYTDTIFVKSSAIQLLIGEPAVPSGFTPNNDGSNDVLYVKGGPFKTLDYRIFNEWGNQIFQSQIQSSGWDGTYKDAPQPVGKFIWTVNGELIDGRTVKLAGEVILHR